MAKARNYCLSQRLKSYALGMKRQVHGVPLERAALHFLNMALT